MANVLFTRTPTPDSIEKIDGQLIFDTSGNGKMYLDNGTTRMEMGGAMTVDSTLSKTSTNPIQNRGVAGVMLDNLNDINNVTSTGFLADAMAVKELNGKLRRPIYFGDSNKTNYVTVNLSEIPIGTYLLYSTYNGGFNGWLLSNYSTKGIFCLDNNGTNSNSIISEGVLTLDCGTWYANIWGFSIN